MSEKNELRGIIKNTIKIILTVLLSAAIIVVGLPICILLGFARYWSVIVATSLIIIPAIIIMIWNKRKSKIFIICSVFLALWAILFGVQTAMMKYEEHITINVTPNINLNEYLPFDDDSKIVKYDSKTLKLNENLPVLDGATAVFPVYSAFVNAVYPDTTKLRDGVFEYNNTSLGYQLLARRETDVFFGAYPSKEQIEYSTECGTTFEYTEIGTEAFVFFVHKNNPISSLTVEQIKGIYSGKITNWSEVGGANEEIAAFQRNEGSGSQSMLKRFMGDTPIMEPKTEEVNGFMGGIIEQVADYRSTSGSIGFSFRYYVEGIIKHPDIKMIAIDGIAPTVENIKSGSYPIVTPLYAVTYAENDNENIDALLEWILSDEGQYIIEETGYVGISK